MTTLHLNVKKEWFELIATGVKLEEYRDIKDYWIRRLTNNGNLSDLKQFDRVIFKNGYSKRAPKMKFNIKSITIDEGYQEWGAIKGKKYFVIKLEPIAIF